MGRAFGLDKLERISRKEVACELSLGEWADSPNSCPYLISWGGGGLITLDWSCFPEIKSKESGKQGTNF